VALIELDVIQESERRIVDDAFRAELASVQSDGRRKWIYAKKPNGKFYRYRTLLSIVLLAFLALAPFVKIGNEQFLLFGLLDRKFVLFGYPLWPEDFYLVVILFLTGLVSIVVFTATLGRIWCGWLCPQTVFLEMVFRKIEWLIEGTAGQQITRHKGTWTFDRVWRFALKQTIFFAMSFAIANIFLAYFVSGDTLKGYVTDGPSTHIELFLALVAFTVVFYLVFARFREQACLVVCPYGRFMSALVDENTVTITYDQKRGEPRSKWKRSDARSSESSGHCIDCHACVDVCPTGIDIRNGIQLECVACTACIDACDDVMEKVNLPKGLIRYASSASIQSGVTKWLTPRVKAYGMLWIALLTLTSCLFYFRSDLDIAVLRSPGTTWTRMAGGVANFYDLKIINKTDRDLPYSLIVSKPQGATITPLGLPNSVAPGEMIKGRFLVTLPDHNKEHEEEHEHGSMTDHASEHSMNETHIVLDVMSGGKRVKQITTELLTP
jgi:cytochrome c oxidase accessory protein FixG